MREENETATFLDFFFWWYNSDHCRLQHPPLLCGAYGSSVLLTGPHTDGTYYHRRGTRHQLRIRLNSRNGVASQMVRTMGMGGGGEQERKTNKMICSCLAVSYDACTRFAYTYAWAAEVFPQSLVVLNQATELQLGHGWLWA